MLVKEKWNRGKEYLKRLYLLMNNKLKSL